MPIYYSQVTDFVDSGIDPCNGLNGGLALEQLQKLNSQYDNRNMMGCQKLIRSLLNEYLTAVNSTAQLDRIKLFFKEERKGENSSYFVATINLHQKDNQNPRILIGRNAQTDEIYICLELPETTGKEFTLADPYWLKTDEKLINTFQLINIPKSQIKPAPNSDQPNDLIDPNYKLADQSFISKHPRLLLAARLLLLGLIGFILGGGLAAGFIFTAPVIIPLVAGKIGLIIGIIAAAAVTTAILFPLFDRITTWALQDEKSRVNWFIRNQVVAGLIRILASVLLSLAAPAVGALVFSNLGVGMTVISVFIASLLIGQTIGLLDALFARVNSNNSFLARLLKLVFRATLIALPLAGLTIGILFGAAPTVGAIVVAAFASILPATLSIATVSALAMTMTITSIVLAAMVVGLTAAIGFSLYGKIYECCTQPKEIPDKEEELQYMNDSYKKFTPLFQKNNHRSHEEADSTDIKKVDGSSTTPGRSIWSLCCGATNEPTITTKKESETLSTYYNF